MDRKGFFICWGGQGARALVCTTMPEVLGTRPPRSDRKCRL